MISFFEIILIIVIAYFTFAGFKSGFIRTVGGIIGLLVGVFFASRYYDILAVAWSWLFFGSSTVAKVVLFILIFILIDRLFKLVVYFLDKLFNLLKFIPFTKFINKLAGGIFGLIEGLLIVGLFLYIAVRFPISKSLINAIKDSEMAGQLLNFVNILTPLIADTLEKIKVL